jgi:cell division protein FtsL
MTQLVIAPKLKEMSHGTLGARRISSAPDDEHGDDFSFSSVGTQEKKKQIETLEKVVGRIPTLYIIAFFTVFTGCAVLIIWNTLQVNRLTLEKARLESKTEQTTQRIIKLKAQEMQLSAPDRIREIARRKLGMTEMTSSDEVIVH